MMSGLIRGLVFPPATALTFPFLKFGCLLASLKFHFALGLHWKGALPVNAWSLSLESGKEWLSLTLMLRLYVLMPVTSLDLVCSKRGWLFPATSLAASLEVDETGMNHSQLWCSIEIPTLRRPHLQLVLLISWSFALCPHTRNNDTVLPQCLLILFGNKSGMHLWRLFLMIKYPSPLIFHHDFKWCLQRIVNEFFKLQKCAHIKEKTHGIGWSKNDTMSIMHVSHYET